MLKMERNPYYNDYSFKVKKDINRLKEVEPHIELYLL